MVSEGSTGCLPLQLRLPKPFSRTVAPRRPITTTPPGKPPALMPRARTLSIFWRGAADMPSAAGALEGNPPAFPSMDEARTNEANSDVSKRADLVLDCDFGVDHCYH